MTLRLQWFNLVITSPLYSLHCQYTTYIARLSEGPVAVDWHIYEKALEPEHAVQVAQGMLKIIVNHGIRPVQASLPVAHASEEVTLNEIHLKQERAHSIRKNKVKEKEPTKRKRSVSVSHSTAR